MTEQARKVVETQIQEVTVYTNQALIVRRGKISLTGDERELLLTGLPALIRPDSVRAGGSGKLVVKILEVQTEHVYAAEPLPPRVAELTAQRQKLEEQKRALADRKAGLALQRNFVHSLGDKSVERFSQGLARQQINLENANQLLAFLGSQYSTFSTDLAQTDKELSDLQKQIDALEQQLREINRQQFKESYNVIVSISPAGAGDFELEVTYLVDSAGWQPLYDARVAWPFQTVQLGYLAQVSQNTGEDWQAVSLTLSTAKPGLGALPPKPQPWYVDGYSYQAYGQAGKRGRGFLNRQDAEKPMPKPAMAAGYAGGGVPREIAEYEEERFAGDMPSPEPADFGADTTAAEMSNSQGVVTFRLEQSTDIPSDGTPHKTTIFSDEFACRTEYIAMPRLVSYAYLQAIVTNNPQGATLLPGTVNIFRDNVFSGTSPIENIAPGQEFKLSLGIDEGLKIERDLVEREVDKKFIGGHRRTTYAYRLQITNLRDLETTLKLTEQLPVSRNEQVKVRLTNIRPQIQTGEMGALEWTVPLAPKARREIYYQFSVEHPTELTVSGLGI